MATIFYISSLDKGNDTVLSFILQEKIYDNEGTKPPHESSPKSPGFYSLVDLTITVETMLLKIFVRHDHFTFSAFSKIHIWSITQTCVGLVSLDLKINFE